MSIPTNLAPIAEVANWVVAAAPRTRHAQMLKISKAHRNSGHNEAALLCLLGTLSISDVAMHVGGYLSKARDARTIEATKFALAAATILDGLAQEFARPAIQALAVKVLETARAAEWAMEQGLTSVAWFHLDASQSYAFEIARGA